MKKFVRLTAVLILLSMVLTFVTACDMSVITSVIDKITGGDNTDDNGGDNTGDSGSGSNNGNNTQTGPDMTTAALRALYINDKKLKEFDPEVFDYEVGYDVAYGIEFAHGNVRAKTLSTAAKVETEAKNGVVKIKVTSGDGMKTSTYTVKFVPETLDASRNEIVNKDGADAAVSYVIDDGYVSTGEYALEFMQKYDYLNLSFAIEAHKFTTIKTERRDDGKIHYIMDGDKYTFEQTSEQKAFTLTWMDYIERAQALGRKVEIINHSYNHRPWGNNDNGGTQSSLNGDKQTYNTGEHAVGSSTAQIYATQQILDRYFGSYFDEVTTLPYIIAGIGLYANANDPESYYYYFYNNVLKPGIENDTVISARSGFAASDANKATMLPANVVTAEKYASDDYRLSTPSYMINRTNGGASADDTYLWTEYIDTAIEMNGWAPFCVHYIVPDGSNYTKHDISYSQADALFGYVEDKNVWVGTYTDVSRYYAEWATATLNTEYDAKNDEISVTITDEENDEVFNLYLTAKIYIPAAWESAFVGSDELEIKTDADGYKFVYVNVVPDAPDATVITEAAK